MKEVNFKLLCRVIIAVSPRTPLTYLAENSLIFRGQTVQIIGFKAKSRLFEFVFTNPISFIDQLKNRGLMLNYKELDRIIRMYEKESEREFTHEKY